MIEIPLSIVAWVSVVVVQAVIHFVVFAARRERIQQDEDIVLEESLSLATNEGSLDAYDDSSITEPFDLPDIGAASDKSMADLRALSFSGENDDDEPNFLELLSQTGSQLAQVSTTTMT
jgi:Tfp pilus assembly protein FimV